jgi:16S rRNA (adenine1518-N6/adenine1519-N6)-dimethyltransferase
MQPRFAELGVEAEPFIAFLKQSFAQKRKTLAKNLRAAGFASDLVTRALQSAEVAPASRAEELGLDAMARIWHALR